MARTNYLPIHYEGEEDEMTAKIEDAGYNVWEGHDKRIPSVVSPRQGQTLVMWSFCTIRTIYVGRAGKEKMAERDGADYYVQKRNNRRILSVVLPKQGRTLFMWIFYTIRKIYAGSAGEEMIVEKIMMPTAWKGNDTRIPGVVVPWQGRSLVI